MSQDNDTLNEIWENWRVKGGAGNCQGCPAHWSIRDDYPGEPSNRETSCGHRPFYGDGSITDVDVAIFGHEPGNDFDHDPDSDPNQFGPNYTEYKFDEARGSDITNVPKGSGSIDKTAPLFELLDDQFQVYWSQTKKCNQMDTDQQNNSATGQCLSYLTGELEEVDPDYVISLGVKAYDNFRRVFNIDDFEQNFARGIAAGERPSGFQTLTVNDQDFVYIPINHPSYNLHRQTDEKLDLSNPDEPEIRHYYRLVAQDLIEYIEG